MEVAIFLGLICFGVVVWALVLWAGIALVDRHNRRNDFACALGWSLVHLMFMLPLLAARPGPHPIELAYSPLAVVLGAWSVSLLLVLVRWYRLSLVPAIAIVTTVVFGPFSLVSMFGHVTARGGVEQLVILYGVP